MNEPKNSLTEILTQIGKEEITLSRAKGLFSKAKIIFWENDERFSSPKNSESREKAELAFKILFKFSKITDRFVEKWQKGEVQPEHEELVLLARAGDEILLVLTYFEAKHNFVFLGNNCHVQIVKSIQNIRDTEEKFFRQVHQISFIERGNPKKEFPWLRVVVFMGGIILVLCGVIAYLLWKKQK